MSQPLEDLDAVGRAVVAAQRFDARVGLVLHDLKQEDLTASERVQVLEAARLAQENAAYLVAAVGGRCSYEIEPRPQEVAASVNGASG